MKNRFFVNKSCIELYNEDCRNTLDRLQNDSINCIITSPPYNMTKRKGGYGDKEKRYDSYNDWMDEDEYISFLLSVFDKFSHKVAKNGVILLNLSYSIENPSLPYKLITSLIQNTPFNLIDTIIWKKQCGVPFPANGHRLSRIVEFIFVFTYKGMENSYINNRKVTKVSEKTKQKYYKVDYNFVEARNNDGSCDLNKATYSSELVEKLLDIYVKDGQTVYDPFNGTGTTGVACIKRGIHYIGSEISLNQVDYSIKRLKSL